MQNGHQSPCPGTHPRWLGPAAANACRELRDIAPSLSSLLYVPAMPDRTLHVLLAWAEIVAGEDTGSAFALDRLRTVLPALVTAFVAAHTYTRAHPGDNAGQVIDLHDQGCGRLVGTVMSHLGTIAAALHGDDGRRLACDARSDLAEHLGRIAALVVGR